MTKKDNPGLLCTQDAPSPRLVLEFDIRHRRPRTDQLHLQLRHQRQPAHRHRLTATGTPAAHYNAANQISDTCNSYDGAGNLTASPTLGAATYNAAGQMTCCDHPRWRCRHLYLRRRQPK